MYTTPHPKPMQPLQTRDIKDPNSLFAASHSRGKGRTETRQTETLHHFKWSFFCFS